MGRSAHLLVGNGAVEIKACLVDWMDLPTKSMLRHAGQLVEHPADGPDREGQQREQVGHPDELAGALRRMESGRVAVIPDRHGTGTNGLLMAPPDAIGPAFGPDSCERHLDRAGRAGWTAVREELPSLALDLDTPDDLAELRAAIAAEPKVAPATAAALIDVE